MAKVKKSAKKAAPKKVAAKKAAKPREEREVLTIEKGGKKFKVYDMGVTLDKRNGAKYNRYKTVDGGEIIHIKVAGTGKKSVKKAAVKKAAAKPQAEAPVKTEAGPKEEL